MDRSTRDNAIIRGLLERIEDSDQINQRTLSKELGIALGMTNAYLKRCVKKGWVKVNQVPARRYKYYLTPKGFAEKSRLTAQFFSDSLTFFRRARDSFDRLYAELADQGVERVVLVGADDLTEIAILCSHSHDVTLVGVVNPDGGAHAVGEVPTVDPDDPPRADLWLIAATAGARDAYELACEAVGAHRVVVPDILNRLVGRGSATPGIVGDSQQ